MLASNPLLRVTRPYIEALSQLVFPNQCLGCHARIRHCSNLTVCDDCWRNQFTLTSYACLQCGEHFPNATRHFVNCSHCSTANFSFSHAISAFVAEGLVMKLIHDFKYHSQIELRGFLAELLNHSLSRYEQLCGEVDDTWCLVPVPLHYSRERQRQYNQSWEMGRLLARRRNLPVRRLLKRQRDTRSQARLDRDERLKNLKNAFAPALLARWRKSRLPKKVLLIDDVMTTGSTVEECAKVLRFDLGIEKVVVITIARG